MLFYKICYDYDTLDILWIERGGILDKLTQRVLEDYEITPSTLLVRPLFDVEKVSSQILELEDDFLSPFRPMDIIKSSCDFFGSSYEGRKAGTKQLIGVTHKAPIAIDPSNSIFFFPTTSPLRPQCVWLAHDHVHSFKRLDSKQTMVVFRNKQCVSIDISSSSFENQLHRTAFLKTTLMQRIEETKRKYFYIYRNSDTPASEARLHYTP